uniref:leucine-rich repeat protein n=1 Tax=Bacteroides eggerthii TaxID=28111 RepID=UPI00359C8472
MRVLKEERWALVRTVTAICITAMALICLVLAAGCTNDLTEITENRGTGETLALGTLTTKDANAAHATTRADSPLPDATAWQGFCSGDQLHVAIAAGEGSIFTRSSGIYEYTAAGNIPGSGSWTASTPAYWQRANGNILTLWRGPDCDTATPGAYDMPLTYETDVIQGHALNAWDGNTYTNDADKWRIMDLLRYCSADADLPTAATGMPATGSPLNLILKHSMAQLCVELLPGEGMTAQELQAQVTVHLKSAAATFTIQTDGRPAIYNFENEQNRQDVRLLKNGATSLKFYALMLPGQTFGTNRAMISLHIGDTHFTYTPGTPLTTTENTCHKLVLQVNRTEVSALSVTSTGWQDPTVITQPDEAEAEVILVINETPGTLKDNATLLNALKDATQESPVGLIITGKINDKDLEDLSSLMKYKDGDTNKFKVSSLAIYATGGTTLPHYFASNNPNPNPALKKIILPEGITDTGQISFYNCTALTDVTLPDGLTIINRNAFRSCNALKSIKLPDNLESIEKQAFGFCIALESIDVPNKTKDIGEQAFLVCSGLTSLMIGDGMINIGKEAFLNDTQLQSVTIQSAQAIGEYAFFGCSSLSDVTIDHVKNIGESAFSGCTSLSNLNIKGTESIGGNAFKNCTSLASITLPQTITGIGTFAFAGSGLTSITIPGSMKQISDEAFNGCTALKTATLEEGVETIGKNAFTNCKELTDITIPSTVTSIGNYAFNICPKLATVTFAGETPQLNSLGQNAFQSCEALTSIDIPDNVTTLATRTFWIMYL